MTVGPYFESESELTSQPPDEAVVAAVAAAIAYLRGGPTSVYGLGTGLHGERSGWWRAGLADQTLQGRIEVAPPRHGEPE